MSLTLDQLVKAIPAAWNDDTRDNKNFVEHPAHGQAIVSALLIQKHCGGHIVYCEMGSYGGAHYFNELDNGVQIDVACQQYLRRSPKRKQKLNPHRQDYIKHDTMRRVEILESRVLDVLNY